MNMCMETHHIKSVAKKRELGLVAGDPVACLKKLKVSPEKNTAGAGGCCDLFDSLPDDIVLSILSKLSSTATCPTDYISVLITCKRLNGLGLSPTALSKTSRRMLAIKAYNWSESAHRFLKHCADAGNIEACFTLGMILFYCLQDRSNGASLMAKAAMSSHPGALYSLAIIQFNGSGGTKNAKDLQAGASLCARAAFIGHVDALRELGHCLQDGYGVRRSVIEGRRCLLQANARELATVLVACPDAVVPRSWLEWTPQLPSGGPLLSDFGCNVPTPAPHPAHRFLSEWFAGREPGPGLRMCSHGKCGRPETRRNEFRRCSVCGKVNYCSRACQAMDWKVRHKRECVPVEGGNVDGENDEEDEEEEEEGGM